MIAIVVLVACECFVVIVGLRSFIWLSGFDLADYTLTRLLIGPFTMVCIVLNAFDCRFACSSATSYAIFHSAGIALFQFENRERSFRGRQLANSGAHPPLPNRLVQLVSVDDVIGGHFLFCKSIQIQTDAHRLSLSFSLSLRAWTFDFACKPTMHAMLLGRLWMAAISWKLTCTS